MGALSMMTISVGPMKPDRIKSRNHRKKCSDEFVLGLKHALNIGVEECMEVARLRDPRPDISSMLSRSTKTRSLTGPRAIFRHRDFETKWHSSMYLIRVQSICNIPSLNAMVCETLSCVNFAYKSIRHQSRMFTNHQLLYNRSFERPPPRFEQPS